MEIPGDIFRFTRVIEKRLLVLLRSNLILPKSRMLPNYTLLIPPAMDTLMEMLGTLIPPVIHIVIFLESRRLREVSEEKP